MHVDPNSLRRELAGSFPAPTTSDNETNNAPDQSAEANADAALPQERPFTLPTGDPNSDDTVVPRLPGAAPGLTLRAQPTSPESEVTPIPASSSPVSGFARNPTAGETPPNQRDPSILVTNQMPVITSDIRGPKQVLVGRDATFRVRIQNRGDIAADSINVVVRVPSWAEVVDTAASNGTVGQSSATKATGSIEWQVAQLPPGANETLDLRLIPRSSRPLELGVTWTTAPVGSRAVVEVQEPKLDMTVSGPDEVLFGKPQLYRFTLHNPGTGLAENVKIDLFPPGGGEKPAATNELGNLPPGKSQTVEVELIARDPGKLAIKALASAEGGLSAEALKDVFCRKPELSVDWRGPDMKYAGTEATYYIRVRNPGTAAAEDVTVRATLPEGAQFQGASEGQSFDASRREIAWRVGSLGPGDDYYMELKCTVNTPGVNRLRISAATVGGDLTDSKSAETNVVALADLKLEVTDPSGPVAVGEEAVYEIRVQNRGASSAKDINVVALFSAGVEPDKIEGAMYSVSDGRVSFRAIEELPAGRQITLQIRARAIQPGTHVFRAEVLCRELDIKLAAEETTRFFADDSVPDAGAGQSSPDPSAGFAPVDGEQ
jgi:uncharacterized repeat protein (TIGR01451 family)